MAKDKSHWGLSRFQRRAKLRNVCYEWRALWVLYWSHSWEQFKSTELVSHHHVVTWDQALFFFASLAREGKKKNAWYTYLTSHQPPPNLHNLTSAWPVMLLANKRLPYGNQILARIMSLLKSILGKRKFLNTSMFRWRFLKKKLMCCFCDEILLAGAAVPLFNSYK